MPGKIEHIIVLMLENRSFDHMLGFLDHPSPDFPKLTGDERNGSARVSSSATYEIRSPDHSHEGVMKQLFGGDDFPEHGWVEPTAPYPTENTNQGFRRSYYFHCGKSEHAAKRVMRCFHPDLIPVFAGLAKEYAVCTRWFCSVPGETWPNRDFAVAATSFGKANQSYWFRNTTDTIFHRLQAAGRTWRIYHDGCAHTWLYPALPQGHFSNMRSLLRDIENDTLPEYAFIEPDYGIGSSASWARSLGIDSWFGDTVGNSQHPGQAQSRLEFVAGEHLIAGIYNALLATMDKAEPGHEHESLFARTLFVITYDEHGGFFDRARPPSAVPPDDRKHGTFCFDLLGPRVPALLISPWIARGTIVGDRDFDHSSIPATVRKVLAPDQPPLTRRDAAAATFDDVVGDSLRTPRGSGAARVRRMEPMEPAIAFTEEERFGATGNPADMPKPDLTLRDNLLWLTAATARRLDGADTADAPDAPPTFASAEAQRDFVKSVVSRMQGMS